ncbi:hypothetical protein [Actinomycetospora atypica]|uniref:Uncharacterized protein n=1 Tax=Actinomycetospora atypica TaxID=1290095 RepID=A0ABV9YLD3_9PSEU
MALRLPVGEVTALLGPGLVRCRIMAGLDDGSGRGEGGGPAAVTRLQFGKHAAVATRLAAIREARGALVLADRVTDGLEPGGRREVLVALRDLAATGVAVLVNDADPVAALAVAGGVLRADRTGGLALERADEGIEKSYLAS